MPVLSQSLGKRSLLVLRFASCEAAMRGAGIGAVPGKCPLLALRAWMEREPGSAEARGAFGFADLLGNVLP
jgi:hypothetical protein